MELTYITNINELINSTCEQNGKYAFRIGTKTNLKFFHINTTFNNTTFKLLTDQILQFCFENNVITQHTQYDFRGIKTANEIVLTFEHESVTNSIYIYGFPLWTLEDVDNLCTKIENHVRKHTFINRDVLFELQETRVIMCEISDRMIEFFNTVHVHNPEIMFSFKNKYKCYKRFILKTDITKIIYSYINAQNMYELDDRGRCIKNLILPNEIVREFLMMETGEILRFNNFQTYIVRMLQSEWQNHSFINN